MLKLQENAKIWKLSTCIWNLLSSRWWNSWFSFSSPVLLFLDLSITWPFSWIWCPIAIFSKPDSESFSIFFVSLICMKKKYHGIFPKCNLNEMVSKVVYINKTILYIFFVNQDSLNRLFCNWSFKSSLVRTVLKQIYFMLSRAFHLCVVTNTATKYLFLFQVILIISERFRLYINYKFISKYY